eukprot:1680069-Rhodomonas_salina.1
MAAMPPFMLLHAGLMAAMPSLTGATPLFMLPLLALVAITPLFMAAMQPSSLAVLASRASACGDDHASIYGPNTSIYAPTARRVNGCVASIYSCNASINGCDADIFARVATRTTRGTAAQAVQSAAGPRFAPALSISKCWPKSSPGFHNRAQDFKMLAEILD